MFYYKTDFEFTQRSINLITNLFSSRWSSNFSHDAEYNSMGVFEYGISPVNRELKLFLSKFNLNLNYAGINVFLSNLTEKTKTNPHIDVLHKTQNLLPIKSRFNVMILGNPNDPMFWWDKIKFGDPDHVEHTFTYSGHSYKSLGIPGDTVAERWQYLGHPSEIKQNLLTPSAFVNTNYAHSLELSPGPRLILSVPLDINIEDIKR
jgi:hypothetical protein